MLSPSSWLSVLSVERTILIEAARLRGRLVLRLPDAMHVATAAAAGCDVLLSNDRRLKVPAGMVLRRLR
jgi:predicted nucleic acid-binding protein